MIKSPNFLMLWACLAIALVFHVSLVSADGRRIRCYKCISTTNGTGNYRLKGDDCLDPFNTNARNRDAMVRCSNEAVGCLKMYRKIDGIEYMKRLCIYSRPPSADYCDEWNIDNAEGIDCYCHKDGCNAGSKPTSFIGFPFLLLLVQYLHLQVVTK